MSTDSQQNTTHTPSLEFKSSTFSVPVLVLASNNVDDIEQQLKDKVSLAPEFFRNSPLVFDLEELNKHDLDIDIDQLTKIIRSLNLLPIGIRGGNTKQNKRALALGIPVHSGHTGAAPVKPKAPVRPKNEEPVAVVAAAPKPEQQTEIVSSTLITQPIRSGQRIYAKGDLIILAQVSAGAEILAEGNIHVYGSLRGRALAGVQGNTEARIFCSDLQAELISIAGTYKLSEDLNETAHTNPVQIYLQNNTLIIKDTI